MSNFYKDNEFEALLHRAKDQAELLYRMTQIDLQVFTGYISLQLILGAWLATNHESIESEIVKLGLLAIDFSLSVIAFALIFNNFKRRVEVVGTLKNCNLALGYDEKGIYLENRALNTRTNFRPWACWYFLGIFMGFFGVLLVLFGAS